MLFVMYRNGIHVLMEGLDWTNVNQTEIAIKMYTNSKRQIPLHLVQQISGLNNKQTLLSPFCFHFTHLLQITHKN